MKFSIKRIYKIASIFILSLIIFSACESKETETVNTVRETVLQTESVPEEVIYPLDEQEEIEEVYVATRSKIDKIMFVGDIFFSDNVKKAYDKDGIDGIISKEYKSILNDSDIVMANLECAITDKEHDPANKDFVFALPEKYAIGLKKLGIKLVTIANNHILDYGENALLNTIKVLSKNGITAIGAGKNAEQAEEPFFIEIDGKKYAIFAASAVLPKDSWKATENKPGIANGYDISFICDKMRKIRDSVDKIIVYMHWGEELKEYANELQVTFAHKLVDYGADLVIGSHPHVLQEIEYYNGVPIVYSLGNFIYGGNIKDTMILEAQFNYNYTSEGFVQLRVHPGRSSYEKTTWMWKNEERKNKLKEMQKKISTCVIADNGYVVTFEQINDELARLASMSETEREEYLNKE